MDQSLPSSLHALLIGIDGYAEAPLAGCVNDIRDVQRFLIEDLGVSAATITTLLAPSSSAQTPDPAPELSAPGPAPTYQNLVAALGSLTGAHVKSGDRVLIYYSGHGSFQKVNSAQAYFEGLVPIDYEDSGLLFDLELNRLLQAIVQRGADLSVILDCCNSAGATRDIDNKDPEWRSRNLRIGKAAPAAAERRLQTLSNGGGTSTSERTPSQYTVLCACHADEKATECRRPPRIGRPHGLLTATLLEMLRNVRRDRGAEALSSLRFAEIFPTLEARVFAENPKQRPQLLGPPERRIFGGPWQPRDLGYRVLRDQAGGYVLGSGMLAGLSRDARLAVYGPEPARFPQLGTRADLEARIGELTITALSPATAKAVPTPPGAPFELPMGARARLLRPGELSYLRVSALDSVSASRRARLSALQAENAFVLLPPGEGGAELIVGQYPNGDLWLGDDICGPGEPYEPTAPGPMAVMPRDWADDPLFFDKGLAAAVRHYMQYAISLRVYRNGGFSLPSNAVSLRLIDVQGVPEPSELTRQHFLRKESLRNAKGVYQVPDGAEVAIEVSNELNISLFANLFLCSLEGHVYELATDILVQGRSRVLFWYEGIDGQPFPLSLPDGHTWGIDRLVAIVTDQGGLDLKMLRQDASLYESILATIESKNVKPLARKVDGIRYVAQLALIQIGTAPAARAFS